MVIGIFVLCDLSKPFAGFFMLRWWGAIGRNAFSLYLLHGIIFWTWGAWLCLKLLIIGTPYWAAITVVFITS
jgi:peptidoglycan/LPS O-acetylase OafA/YrhL